MKARVRLFSLALMVILFSALWVVPCFGQFWKKKEPAAVTPSVVLPETIILQVTADIQLNLYDSLAHALHLCVYQLTDSNRFQQLSGDEKGLIELMDCDRVDPSVAAARRIVLQPGEEQTVEMDRAEDARYVGIVAGYYPIQKRNAVRLYRLPAREASSRGAGQGPFRIRLHLGSRSLIDHGERP
ncbi:MAG: type VI secretion system lipoprotein TssJ [Deltaproteobacteria bacterium]|nr:type VI secretion system lipoprotein TssJ [Deltaproteobacteria bacterium]